MTISIRSSFAFTTEAPIDAMLQFEAADIPEQKLLSCNTDMTEAAQCIRIPAQEEIGERVEAIREWVSDRFTYAPGSSDAHTTALDSFVERRGICRDFAHVVISLARASTIPARYVACYGPDVSPQDFHAVAEVFLHDPESKDGGTWQLVDATGMARADEIVKIGVGRDAADVSFLTSFGMVDLCEKTVEVSRD